MPARTPPTDRACIIGAGSSGIASCQAMHARGIPFDCFESGSDVGGNWRYNNDNGMSSAATARRYGRSARHAIQVDFLGYLREIGKERAGTA